MTATTEAAAVATTSPEASAVASLMSFAVLGAFYLIPTWVAMGRNVERKGGIITLNIFLGWTGLGWIGALIWAFSADTKAVKQDY